MDRARELAARKLAAARVRVTRLIDGGDAISAVSRWPAWLRKLALDPRIKRLDRFKLFTFLAHNGVAPQNIRGIMTLWPRVFPELTRRGNHIEYHVDEMIHEFFDGTRAMRMRYYMHPVFDLIEGRVITMV
jgi:hypothetical protein